MEPVAIKALESAGYNLPAPLPALLPSGLSLRLPVTLYLSVDSSCIRIRPLRAVYVRAVYVIYGVTCREAIMKYTMRVSACVLCTGVVFVFVCLWVFVYIIHIYVYIHVRVLYGYGGCVQAQKRLVLWKHGG